MQRLPPGYGTYLAPGNDEAPLRRADSAGLAEALGRDYGRVISSVLHRHFRRTVSVLTLTDRASVWGPSLFHADHTGSQRSGIPCRARVADRAT